MNQKNNTPCRNFIRLFGEWTVKLVMAVFSGILLFSFFFFYSCASLGSPEGGDYDETPPRFIKSFPVADATHFDGHKIELLFDEYISIEKPSEKVIITPPQKQMPVIRAIGKKISVELKDSLIANTTYTFDFTNGIVDNNEKNPLEGFAFAFSTGDIIDSLMISGLLLNAENLEPQPNIIVGIHSNPEDSAFTSLPFVRTTMTNDRGKFGIRNVAPGNYRLFALKDMNRNYRFDQKTEEIAFYDSLIVPSFEPAIRMDTTWVDSLTVDTIKEVHYTRFTPDDITLFLFQENFETQYLSKTERPVQNQLVFHFNSGQGLPPALFLLKEDSIENIRENWYIPEYSPDKKDIIYWISDSLLYERDTIRLEVDYLQTDTLFNLSPITDTLRFIRRKEAPTKKSKKEKEKEAEVIDFLKIDFSLKNTADIFDTLKVTFSEPVQEFDPKKIRIQQKVDTLWESRVFPITGDTLNPRIFYINNDWAYGREFQIIVDSAAIFSIYDKWNDSTAVVFKFKEAEEYVNIYMKIMGVEGPGFGELLNSSDKVVRTSALYDGELIFENMNTGKYYLRYIEDANGNGKWDTGNYENHLQPEKVYYYPNLIELPRKNTDLESEWNIREIPVDKQKPLDITKNKPAQKKPKRSEQTGRNQQRNNTNQSGSNRMNAPAGGSSTRMIQQNTTR
ncbi:MAG: Ig-like domain-containing protein [Dysgonamonadaceae bacterium]|jgi:uncharacterized protein (DUF2141 family)|nr:Ig-like domain-containing protein [Dysgonamonadaceae bacterium]